MIDVMALTEPIEYIHWPRNEARAWWARITYMSLFLLQLYSAVNSYIPG